MHIVRIPSQVRAHWDIIPGPMNKPPVSPYLLLTLANPFRAGNWLITPRVG